MTIQISPRLPLLAAVLLLAASPAGAQQRPDDDVSRGIAVRPVAPVAPIEKPEPAAVPVPLLPVAPVVPAEPAIAVAPAVLEPEAKPPAAATLDDPVRVAAAGVDASALAGLSQQTPWLAVAAAANPDLVWDAALRQVQARGRVIAENIGRDDLPGVIERTASIRWLKSRAAGAPQTIRLFPDEDVHRAGQRVEIRVDELQGRALILFNIAGNGTVQLLYPQGGDARVWIEPQYRMPFKVAQPFGTDQVVAVTSAQAMPELERAIRQLDKRRNPFKAVEMIRQYAPADALVGSVALSTAP